MELFPRTSRARIRYDSNRLLSFRDACTEAPKELENRDNEGLTICAGASGSKFYDKETEDERNKKYGNRGFNCTQTQEIGPLELPPAIAKGFKNPWGTQSEKETVCSTAKRILSKLTPENYEELAEQLVPELVQAGMTSAGDLVAVTSLIYNAAVMKPGLYAKLCVQLSKTMPEFPDLGGEKPMTFRRVLLNSCQEVFHGLDALREEIKNLTKPEQVVERDEKEKWAKLRTLGNIKLIGELFNERMLPEKIVHACIQRLLEQDQKGTLVEENVEALCLLFTTLGKQLAESAKWKLAVDKYFALLKVIGETKFGLRPGMMALRRLRNGRGTMPEMPRMLGGGGGMPGAPMMGSFMGPGLEADGWETVSNLHKSLKDGTGVLPVPGFSGPMGGAMPGAGGQARFGSPGMRASGVGTRVLQGSGYGFVGKTSALLGSGSPKPVAELAKVPEPAREVLARPAPAAAVAAAASAPSADLTKKSESLLKEYFSIVDLNEALLCVQELKSPSFHPEFVRLAIATALDMRDKECDLVLKLLVHLHSRDAISISDLRGGVLLVSERMEDISIDAPLAPKRFGGMLAGLVLSGAVELRLVQEASLKLEDDFLQEDVLKAVVGKWKLKESEVQLGEVCWKASVDKKALLSMVVPSDLANLMPFGECGAASMPFMAHDHLDMRTNKDDFNQRSHLSRPRMFGKQGANDQARFRSLSVQAGGEVARPGYDCMYVSQLSLGTRSPTTPPGPADLTRKSVSLVKEYLDIEDLNEALLCVQELNSPRFHPEFVRLAITTAMDMREKECSLVLKLLAHLQSEKVISSVDLKEGVLRVLKGLVDIKIDSPLAPKLLGGLLAGLVLSGAVELTLVQVSLWKLEEEFLQQDVLNAVVAKWKLQENQVQLVDMCRKASVDKEALLSVAVASDLVKVMEIGAGRAAATPELTLHDNSHMRSNKDEFNLRSLLQRVQMHGKPCR